MDWLEQLVEARMRDWERRVREGTAPPPPEATALAPGLEVQLWKEILALRQLAAERPADRDALRARSRDLETQLWILLERTGRPLAAARLQAELRNHP
jgi:hypothetical protein